MIVYMMLDGKKDIYCHFMMYGLENVYLRCGGDLMKYDV